MFASDIYSLGVTMFQMLTGDLPYDTPSPADLERLMRGELLVAARALKNPKVSRGISDIVLKAMAPEMHARYQRAERAARGRSWRRSPTRRPAERPGRRRPATKSRPTRSQDIQTRLKARETPQARFCWHCRKPLHARSDRCPFCGETQ